MEQEEHNSHSGLNSFKLQHTVAIVCLDLHNWWNQLPQERIATKETKPTVQSNVLIAGLARIAA